MNPISLGPLVLSGERFLVALALALFLISAEGLARRHPELSSWAWNAVVAGLVAARLFFVALHLSAYAVDPVSVLYVWQGGFSLVGGLVGAVLYTLIHFWGAPRRLVLTLVPSLVAVLVWSGGMYYASSRGATSPAPTLFSTELVTLAGETQAPSDFAGSPVVVNLWATWCAPCRRELPLLAEVAAAESEVVFLFVSQGESAERVEAYLAEQGLELPRVLLDPDGELGRASRSVGLPTTLFFDRAGKLVDRSLGELSRARLMDGVGEIRGD